MTKTILKNGRQHATFTLDSRTRDAIKRVSEATGFNKNLIVEQAIAIAYDLTGTTPFETHMRSIAHRAVSGLPEAAPEPQPASAPASEQAEGKVAA